MIAHITGETNNIIGISVVDNRSKEHVLDLSKYSGSVPGHQQEWYPDDPAERTTETDEHINQVRQFARWHVYRERGHDIVTPYENPDRIVAAALALLEQDDSVLQRQFGDLTRAIRRHYEDDSVDVPLDDVSPDDILVYRKDMWLEQDPTSTEPPLLEQFCDHVSEPLTALDRFINGPNSLESLPQFDVQAVSDLHYLHSTGTTNYEHFSEQPLDRDPDARIEVMPVDLGAFDSIGVFLASHLANQVRDCFLEMGVEPPEPFRVRGLGKYDSMVKQQLMPMYERYYQTDVPISSWDPSETLPE